MDFNSLTYPTLLRIIDERFSSSSTASYCFLTSPPLLIDFIYDRCVLSAEADYLEWLSEFLDDSYSNIPENPLTIRPEKKSVTEKPKSLISRAPDQASVRRPPPHSIVDQEVTELRQQKATIVQIPPFFPK